MRLQEYVPKPKKVPKYMAAMPLLEEFLASGSDVMEVVLEDGDPKPYAMAQNMRTCISKRCPLEVSVHIRNGQLVLERG